MAVERIAVVQACGPDFAWVSYYVECGAGDVREG